MTEEEVSALLGRPLTAVEVSNFALYMELATQQLQDWLCYELTTGSSTKKLDARKGYTTLFTPPFTAVTSISKDGSVVSADDYTVKQGDNYSGTWFNSIVFNNKLENETIEVTAVWGFADATLPVELRLLLANAFALQASNAQPKNVKRKKVEDFDITYTESTPLDDLLQTYGSIIYKYSICGQVNVQHGYTGQWPHNGRIPSFY